MINKEDSNFAKFFAMKNDDALKHSDKKDGNKIDETISDKWSDITDSDMSATDLCVEDKENRTSNTFKTTVNIIKMYVGVIFLSISGCIGYVGVGASIIGMTYVLIINIYCLYILLKARNRFKHHKVVDIVELAVMLYGEKARVWMSIVLFSSNMMYLCFYQMFFGTQIDLLVCKTF